MNMTKFNEVVQTQTEHCLSLLVTKGAEYAPDSKVPEFAYEEVGQTDRLAHFKKAAAIMNSTPKAALLGMLSKHLVSVSDMCVDKKDYSIEKWDEKITDSINYLLILRALIEEEKNEKN